MLAFATAPVAQPLAGERMLNGASTIRLAQMPPQAPSAGYSSFSIGAAAAVAGAITAGSTAARARPRRQHQKKRSAATSKRVVQLQATGLPDLVARAAVAEAVEAQVETANAWNGFEDAWEVHKFGGASLATAELYKTCGELLRAQSSRASGSGIPTAAVVSAAGGMTDHLVSVITAAEKDVDEAAKTLKEAKQRQKDILVELVPDRPDLTDPVCANIDRDADGVAAMLTAVSVMRLAPPQMLELVAGLGEVWSAQTLSCYLKASGEQADWVDARDVLFVPELSASGLGEKGMALEIIEPLWDETTSKLNEWWADRFGPSKAGSKPPFIIITGFVCRTLGGRPTTLKRSGSDYSATIFAKVMNASRVTMWKNVNGVYTADPRMVPMAFPIPTMTFDEAMELAYFGGQVLHPSAMVPLIEKRIPCYVRNVFNPVHPGTKVYGRGDDWLRWPDQDEASAAEFPVTAITSIENVALVTLTGASFLGSHGVNKRMMEGLANASVNVILTSMGSSEHSITVAMDEADGERGTKAVEEAFALEMSKDPEIRVGYRSGCSILAVIGEGMKSQTGIGGRFFKSMGNAGVNIMAIAQGSSERNISVVVSREDLPRAVRGAHDGFTLSDMTMAVGIIGTGAVATQVLKQIARFEQETKEEYTHMPAMTSNKRLNIQVRAICNRSQMLLAEHGMPLSSMADGLPDKCTPNSLKSMILDVDGVNEADFTLKSSDFDGLEDFLDTKRIPHKVLIDCTESEEVATLTQKWLKRGINVVTSNRLSGAGPCAWFRECLDAVRKDQVHWMYESTLGTQMPVISALHDMLRCGDRIQKVEGLLSGTFGYIFDRMHRFPEVRFSEALREACEKGYTEQNPCVDLAGTDMAHKCVIIGRELGMRIELKDVQVESLIPDTLSAKIRQNADVSSPEHMEALLAALRDGGTDDAMARRVAEASGRGEVLRYVAEVDVHAGTMAVGLRSFPIGSGQASLTGNEVRIAFTTEQHAADTPLVIRCPGAGVQAISSSLFNDFLRLARQLNN